MNLRPVWMIPVLVATVRAAVPAGLDGAVEHVYSNPKGRALSLYVLAPKDSTGPNRPAIIFFFGGGWANGTVEQFAEHARYFAARGRVCILADYRVRTRDNSNPFESVEDARAAIRWVREHAAELRIDPKKIIAAGGSAGGHLAAAAATIPDRNETVTSVPNALVLFNPVVDTTESGYGSKVLGERALELSPTHQLRAGVPPTLIFHGTADRTVPFSNVQDFTRRMRELGNRCELVPFEGADHGFFNSPVFRANLSGDAYRATIERMESFLNSIWQ